MVTIRQRTCALSVYTLSVLHPTQIDRRDFKALGRGENGDFNGTSAGAKYGTTQICLPVSSRIVPSRVYDWLHVKQVHVLAANKVLRGRNVWSNLRMCSSSKVTVHFLLQLRILHIRSLSVLPTLRGTSLSTVLFQMYLYKSIFSATECVQCT